jgi:hypothetical protein
MGTFFYVLLAPLYFTTFQYLILFLQVSIITILLPIAFFLFLKSFGKAESIMLSDVKQRKIPLLLQIVLLFILIQKSITLANFPPLYFFFLAGICSSILALLFIFFQIKISLHAIGISSLTVFIIGLSLKNEINAINLVSFFIIMNGFVAASRLHMNAHTNKELAIGFSCGILPQLVLLWFWL